MTLDQAHSGTIVEIKEISGGKGVVQKLSQMGIHPGDHISIVKSGPLGGPVIIGFQNSEYVIGRGLAKKIHIS